MANGFRAVFLVCTFSVFFNSPSAHAWEFSLVGGGTYSATQATVAGLPQSTTPGLGMAAGMIFSFKPGNSFQLGILYSTRRYTLTLNDISTSIGSEFIEVPLEYQFTVFSFLAMAFGGYAAGGIGSSRTGIDSPPGELIVAQSYEDLNQNRFDYGLTGNLTFRFRLSSESQLVVINRFLIGLANLDRTLAQSLSLRQGQVLVGTRLLF